MKTVGIAIVTSMLAFAATIDARAQRSQAGGGSCDRACLLGIADAYLAAIVAHDPAKALMAPNAKFTEQTTVLSVGEGLWKTALQGPTTFKIAVPDPVADQI